MRRCMRCVQISTTCLCMPGSAISSVDPVATLAVLSNVEVPPLLYNIVFGEVQVLPLSHILMHVHGSPPTADAA